MPKIVLFDVDGTLTEPRKKAGQEMLDFLQELRKVLPVGIVGGSDFKKIKEQLGEDADVAYDYLFSENGLVAHKAGKLLATQSLTKHLGDEKIKEFINFTLRELAEIDIPVKRGTYIEVRNGMLNVSPVGASSRERAHPPGRPPLPPSNVIGVLTPTPKKSSSLSSDPRRKELQPGGARRVRAVRQGARRAEGARCQAQGQVRALRVDLFDRGADQL